MVSAPSSLVRFVNGTARFAVTVSGSNPLTYQWKHGTTDIAGATSASLELTDLQTADEGEYTVVISNPYGSQQASATLTLLTPTKYAGTAAAAGPIGYWRLDEDSGTTAYDYWGGHDGAITNGVTVAAEGPRPTSFNGFDATNNAYQFPGNASAVVIPALNVNKATITIVAWIKPSGDQVDYAGIVFARGTTACGLDLTTGDQLGYHWNDTAETYNWPSGLVPRGDVWNFVALVIKPDVGTIYLDDGSGMQSAENPVSHRPGLAGDPVRIGADSPGGGRGFVGAIDEVTIYDRALSASEIAALRAAGFAGTYNPSPVTFIEQPKSQTIMAGASYTLSARASGAFPSFISGRRMAWIFPGNPQQFNLPFCGCQRLRDIPGRHYSGNCDLQQFTSHTDGQARSRVS